jgi:transposase
MITNDDHRPSPGHASSARTELPERSQVDSTIARAHEHATYITRPQGAGSNYTDLPTEPLDHAIGRSRGGWSTKVHHLVDGNGRPLVVLFGPGQVGDAPMFPHLMRHLRVRRAGRGQARTRPCRLRGDKSYSSRAIRGHLRARRITAVIPEPADQAGHRQRRGSRGGRPPKFDPVDYHGRNVVERGFNLLKQWRGLATRYDKLAIVYRSAAVLYAVTIWTKKLSDTP